ncbi:MAG: hypothetical protein ACE5FH_11510 [Candidatus Zixiibacteriota bacterium]
MDTTSDSGYFIIHVTRETVDGLQLEGFDCDYLTEPPPRKPGRPGIRLKSRKIEPKNDRPKNRKKPASGYGQVWLERVDGAGCGRPCPEEADANGDGAVSDIVDMTFIVDYLFGQAPPPVPCP